MSLCRLSSISCPVLCTAGTTSLGSADRDVILTVAPDQPQEPAASIAAVTTTKDARIRPLSLHVAVCAIPQKCQTEVPDTPKRLVNSSQLPLSQLTTYSAITYAKTK